MDEQPEGQLRSNIRKNLFEFGLPEEKVFNNQEVFIPAQFLYFEIASRHFTTLVNYSHLPLTAKRVRVADFRFLRKIG